MSDFNGREIAKVFYGAPILKAEEPQEKQQRRQRNEKGSKIMSKLSNRIEKLESIAKSSKPTKWVRVIQEAGETREKALAKAGIANWEANNIWYVVPVKSIDPLVWDENEYRIN